MTLSGALTIRINDGHTDRHVGLYASGLKFTKVAPGGHQSCQFTLNLPRNTFTALNAADNCWLYDARTGKTIFGQGYLEQPTPVDGPNGQSFDINANGGMVRANDETRALIYVDQTLDGWKQVQYGNAVAASTGEQWSDGSGTQAGTGMRCQIPQGTTIAGATAVAAVENRVMARAGMSVAGLRVITGSGKIDVNYRTELYDLVNAILTSTGSATQIQQTGVDQTFWVGAAFGTTGAFLLQLRRSAGATTVADDTTWSNFVALFVLGRRYDRNGNLLGTAAAHNNTAQSVLASQVAEDLLGRLLTFCDPGTAQVDVSTFAIDQLAYPDGTKGAGVLNDLALWEPNFVWEILETLDNGKHRFNYRAWPTTPRYVVSTRDGWRQTGGDVDLCNRILVNWTDPFGNPQGTAVTAASLGLTGLGYPVDDLGTRVKDADPVSLPAGKGSTANATQIGGQILTDKVNPPLAGTVVVQRRILDLLTGNYVSPWELEPGYLCRVRELGQDLRITQMDYDDDSVSTTLTLGAPSLTVDQRLAKLSAA